MSVNASSLLMHLEHVQGTFLVDQLQKQIQHQCPESANVLAQHTLPTPSDLIPAHRAISPQPSDTTYWSTALYSPSLSSRGSSLACPCSQGGDQGCPCAPGCLALGCAGTGLALPGVQHPSPRELPSFAAR